jgi:hypothetical protein
MRTNAAEREIDTLCDTELDSVSGGMVAHMEIWLPNIGMRIWATPTASGTTCFCYDHPNP